MLFEFSSYRSYLRACLSERIKRNPAYSLRAMALQLGFAHSSLSEVINGHARFSIASARKAALGLKLKSRETEYFCLLVQLDSLPGDEIRAGVLERLEKLRPKKRKIHDLQLDHYKHIADWHHYAILELATLPAFECTAQNIAQKLSISEIDAQVAVERLERLELLARNADGRMVRQQPNLVVRSETHNAALKSAYKQMLTKTADALDEQDPSERISGFETIAFDKAALPEMKEAFDQFFSELIRISEAYPGKTEVGHVLAHFINLTPKGSKRL